jgi:hypothetical protein
VNFEIISQITDIEIIASNTSIRDLNRLKKFDGQGRWRKLKGIATIMLEDGYICKAELHW